MPAAPTLPVPPLRVPTSPLRLKRRLRPGRLAAAGLLVVCGVAWLGVLKLSWNPSLVLVAMGVAAAGPLVFVRARWAQAVVRAVLWSTLVAGLAIGGSKHSLAVWSAALAVPAGSALLLLGTLGRRVRGPQPMVFVATVLALADAGFHGLVSLYLFDVDSARMWFFAFIAGANLVGLAALRWGNTPWPHVGLNALVLVGVVLDVPDVKGFLLVTLGILAVLQMLAALAATRPPPSPAARRVAARAFRGLVGVAMAVSLVVTAAQLLR